MAGKPHPPGCECAAHSRKRCEPGCTCKRHSGNNFRGRKHTLETKERMRLAALGKNGSHNPEGCMCAAHRPRTREPKELTLQKQRERARRNYQAAPHKQNHGMSPDDFASMWAAQSGCCCYCGGALSRESRLTQVDHDHACCPPRKSCETCRRGLACQRCNALVGRVDDDPDLLELIAVNLRRLKAEAAKRITAQAELPPNVMRFERRNESA